MVANKDSQLSILIIRPSSIGDVVMASPILSVLKEAYPKAMIYWLLEDSLLDILRAHPLVDEIILWNKAQWKQLWKSRKLTHLTKEIMNLRRRMHSKQFDLALEIQGLLRSRILAWLSGARQRIGFESKEPGSFLMSRIVSRGPDSKEMGAEYYHIMREIGLKPDASFRPYLVVPEDCRITSEKKLTSKGVNNEYAVLSPFTTRPQKHWISDKWGELAIELKKSFSLSSVVMGSTGDRISAQRIAEGSKGTCVNLAGETTLGEAMAIVKNASIVVGVDTGLTHMGVAFNVPTIALFGATCPYLHAHVKNFVVIYHKLHCSPCKRRPTCNGKFYCMASIQLPRVLAAANEVLSP